MKKNILIALLGLSLITSCGGGSTHASSSKEESASSSEEVSSSESVSSSEESSSNLVDEEKLQDKIAALYDDNATFTNLDESFPTFYYYGEKGFGYTYNDVEQGYLENKGNIYSYSLANESLEKTGVLAVGGKVALIDQFSFPNTISNVKSTMAKAYKFVDDHLESTNTNVLKGFFSIIGFSSLLSEYEEVFTSGVLKVALEDPSSYEALRFSYSYETFSCEVLVSDIGTTENEILTPYLENDKGFAAKTAWTDDEIAAIQEAIEGEEVLPFVSNLSEASYVSMTERSVSIFDYGEGCDALVSSYSLQLEEAGFSKYEVSGSSTTYYRKAKQAASYEEGKEDAEYYAIFAYVPASETTYQPYGHFVLNYYTFYHPANFTSCSDFVSFLDKRLVSENPLLPDFAESDALGYTFIDKSASQVMASYASSGTTLYGHFAVIELYYGELSEANAYLPKLALSMEKLGYEDSGATLSKDGYLAFSSDYSTVTMNVLTNTDSSYKGAIHLVLGY
ncbi:MAG: hypothetical protein K5694_06715 [Bacilli bacterium]|nr:hypothetical protein [Bacilli bacterium]